MNIRPATVADMERCVALDGAYATEYVWQMDEQVTAEAISVTLRRTRLPRLMTVPYPRATDELTKDLARGECFLVADEGGAILGYVDMTIARWQWRGELQHLIVHRGYRRRGLGASLLAAAMHWGREAGLRGISTMVQTKNDPAIALLSKQHYAFSGLLDRYYNNGDIALVYAVRG